MWNPAQTVWTSQAVIDQYPLGCRVDLSPSNHKIKALTTLRSCCTSPIVCLCVCLSLCVSVLLFRSVWPWTFCVHLGALMSQWFLFKVPKCAFYAPLMPLYTHYINAPWRRPFAWKFSWFMTGFYSIFYNHPAHFCRGLVVAVVMPQYSAVTQLQRPFCSHAPSQKHRVTSLASSGKGGPAGLFCSPLVFFFLPFSVFSLSSSSPVVPPIFFFFSPPEHLLRRFTLAVVDGIIKKKVQAGERAMLVIQVRCVVFQWSLGLIVL